MDIAILTTGGTIDKVYFDRKSAFEVGSPQIRDVLAEANVTLEYEITPLMRKDSLELTDADRAAIRAAVEACPARHIVITHGTDTMVETARVLGGIPHKVVVLTGAMQPARFRTTDAVFNIASAVVAAQLAPPGVHIAMNGRVFDPARTRKNVAQNRFEALS